MQTDAGHAAPYAANTRVILTTDVEGTKVIDGQRVNHTLPAGTIAFIKAAADIDPRTSINPDPLTPNNYLYKLESTVMEKLPQFEVEQPMYVATTDSQKIGHTALNTDECPPQGSRGMYKIGDMSRILHGHQYKYGLGPGAVTLKGGDMISIEAMPTTRTGGRSVMIPKNAYYLQVRKVNYSMVTKGIPWRSKYVVNTQNFQLV
ncbi:hypothetical protein AGABI1DRAFT_115093 [Agaricus bisporus var. burnettii JB137-S8]|uniref:Uncharacterized protein n=1 Tax=Agaricus bisporus var. burnettii (strain JB137-S8 / ATCC MYA-4627 / FGSC 10392) TaxID=597362 RepID=K5WQ43_AGABU|nr:uncharacterized protein AGABI1DRAFT_115093 [Agaricus bisporus var. burnettii JB137-S8]EKM77476.1 hypothetical protein AGABI1DRAFT_115093 [Agaricus bisporus var. burnettii JB137-S8]